MQFSEDPLDIAVLEDAIHPQYLAHHVQPHSVSNAGRQAPAVPSQQIKRARRGVVGSSAEVDPQDCEHDECAGHVPAGAVASDSLEGSDAEEESLLHSMLWSEDEGVEEPEEDGQHVDSDRGTQPSAWHERQQKAFEAYAAKRHSFAAISIAREATPPPSQMCDCCGQAAAVTACGDCSGTPGVKLSLCSTCDAQLHPSAHFHHRNRFDNGFWQPIPSSTTVLADGSLQTGACMHLMLAAGSIMHGTYCGTVCRQVL
jgi:hypothetical protein